MSDGVAVQENLPTSKGSGTALKFVVALGEQLYSVENAKSIADEMLALKKKSTNRCRIGR